MSQKLITSLIIQLKGKIDNSKIVGGDGQIMPKERKRERERKFNKQNSSLFCSVSF